MAGVNKVILVGRLGQDPEVRTIENGAMVANFSIATSETYKDRVTGEKKEITDWHSIQVWRGLAEISQKYLHKGDMVYIEGKMRTRSWEKDNVKHYKTEVIADSMTMLSTQRNGSSNGNSQPASAVNAGETYTATPATGGGSDDLPF